jgi:hypothetical protein
LRPRKIIGDCKLGSRPLRWDDLSPPLLRNELSASLIHVLCIAPDTASTCDMIAAGKHMPLPPPKPKFAEVEARKHNGKDNADLAKSEVDARAAAAYARGATGPRIDWKPSVSHSAAPFAPVSKHINQVDSESTGISASYSRNSGRPIIRLRTRSVALGWGSHSRRCWRTSRCDEHKFCH